MWNEKHLSNINFDIIIEDGLHKYEAHISFFENSVHKLNKNGIYIIEDILNQNVSKITEYMNKNKYKDYIIVKIPSLTKPADNNLLIYKKHIGE